MRNLMNEKLVWMADEDYRAINLAVNIAANLLHYSKNLEVYDLDGDPVTSEQIEKWKLAVDDAHDALVRAKYAPEDALPKLRLIVMSD